MILHTVNRSPLASSLLNQCLNLISPPAALLLIEDGVYAADNHLGPLFEKLPAGVELFALRADCDARGLSDRLNPSITLLSDDQFVELSVRCTSMQAWY